jgi:hypothetical protein
VKELENNYYTKSCALSLRFESQIVMRSIIYPGTQGP